MRDADPFGQGERYRPLLDHPHKGGGDSRRLGAGEK